MREARGAELNRDGGMGGGCAAAVEFAWHGQPSPDREGEGLFLC